MANEITISTNDNDFRSMLIKLMGRGMTMSKSVEGQFVLSLEEITDLVNKIAQRVNLQNHCKMTDFHAEFCLSDGSRETVPSFEKLLSYRSINHNICTKCKMSFAFLIDFNSRGIEKQSIDIEIRTEKRGEEAEKKSDFIDGDFTFGIADINIEYTDVTWANDIKNLFDNYCETHMEQYGFRSYIAPFLSSRNASIFVMPLLFIGLMISSAYRDPNSVRDSILQKIGELPSAENLVSIHEKLDILIYKQNDVRSGWDLMFPIVLIVAVLVGTALASVLIRNIPKSAIILSPEAKKLYDRKETSRGRFNLYAAGGIFASIAVSVIAANIDRLIMAFF